jgi:hypothetical protein
MSVERGPSPDVRNALLSRFGAARPTILPEPNASSASEIFRVWRERGSAVRRTRNRGASWRKGGTGGPLIFRSRTCGMVGP